MMWVLAKGYGWKPSVIDELDLEELTFWIEGLIWLNEK